jgi:O-6-methylguanine DNA methyltransferase
LGWLITAGSSQGLCFVALGDTKLAVVESLRERFPVVEFAPCPLAATKAEGAPPPLREWHQQLLDFLMGSSTGFDIPLDWQGTPFQQRVWRALTEIPHGETRTYAQLAKAIGQPSAVRAVANACGANKLAIVVPCHRVIGSNGQLTGFRWGVERKQALLELEQKAT